MERLPAQLKEDPIEMLIINDMDFGPILTNDQICELLKRNHYNKSAYNNTRKISQEEELDLITVTKERQLIDLNLKLYQKIYKILPICADIDSPSEFELSRFAAFRMLLVNDSISMIKNKEIHVSSTTLHYLFSPKAYPQSAKIESISKVTAKKIGAVI